jgi:hypothetical protein
MVDCHSFNTPPTSNALEVGRLMNLFIDSIVLS